MQFHLASTFVDSLARLPAQDQKAVKASALDLQLDPSSPGLQFHRIERSKDSNFWSVRVNRDIRIIIHKTASSLMLAYVGHHDDAYAWAERRRIEAHPTTGATQIVEVRERVEEIEIAQPKAAPTLFARLKPEDLMSVGVPPDWVSDVLVADSEDRFLELAIHLPSEAGEALLTYAAGGRLETPAPMPAAQPLHHPDALRRFRIIDDVAELQAALDAPWDKWTVYLHPSQRSIVEADYAGPARVVGAAGTGKTVVALHRAARMAKLSSEARVLLVTFSRPLADELTRKVRILLGPHAGVVPRIVVASFQGMADELFQLIHASKPFVATLAMVETTIDKARSEAGLAEFSTRFLLSEWINVIDPWQVSSEDDYARIPRTGRAKRLGAQQRARIWPVFAQVRKSIAARGMFTRAQVLHDVANFYASRDEKPFSHIVVDEAQDLGVAELKMLAALAPAAPNALFFAGDLGQRIFVPPFSWGALGVDVRGRSSTLRVNYRTSHQIRQSADRLLPTSVRDADGLDDNRSGSISTFNGPAPVVSRLADASEEARRVAAIIAELQDTGLPPEDIAVFVRSDAELPRARQAVSLAKVEPFELSERIVERAGRLSIGTMHLAKGLEFRAVIVMACDADVLPLASRVEAASDEAELDDAYQTERHLLYVACTRARDILHVSGVAPGSEFLADLRLKA
jgi:hypothetical protein